MADAPKYPDFSQPSIMNPQYGPYAAKLLGPLIRELQRQQQFAGAFGVSPRQAIKPTPEETQRMLNVGLAFGGADITKEQKEAWEAENQLYRAGRRELKGGPEGTLRRPPPGTRVYIRPSESFARHRDPFHPYPGDANFNAIVIEPDKMPLADKLGWNPLTAEKQSMTPPSPDHLAVQFERPREGGSAGYWFWKHRDELEVLPPKEKFKVGDRVEFRWGEREVPVWEGVVAEPPKGFERQSWMSPDHLWIDVDQQVPEGMVAAKNEKIYPSGTWGSWFDPVNLHKKVKK